MDTLQRKPFEGLAYLFVKCVFDSCKDKKVTIDKDAVLPSNDAIYVSVCRNLIVILHTGSLESLWAGGHSRHRGPHTKSHQKD